MAVGEIMCGKEHRTLIYFLFLFGFGNSISVSLVMCYSGMVVVVVAAVHEAFDSSIAVTSLPTQSLKDGSR
jgi:hypothetical protein